MRVVIKANGGLGNRMRVLASCVALSKRLRNEVEVIWINRLEFNCSYHQLFKPIEGVKIVEKRYISKFNRLGLRRRKAYYKNYGSDFQIQIGDSEIRSIKKIKSDFVKLIQDFETVYIDTCEQFYGDESHLAYLIPQDSITKKIEQRLNKLGSHFVGVHIRRGDNQISTETSTIEAFTQSIEKEIAKANSKVYVCTDSLKELNHLKKKFGSSIVHFPVGLRRNKPAHIESALVDLLLLSKASKIYGSYWSSFSEIASAYGGVELEMVGKEN
ncbi:MAG: hypothetical protein HKP14_01690 [Bacteroidia bacterium]|nr:hypothetical protein [Bacteroidia bacterium]